MYYEEKIIDGVLMHRHIPDGGWKRCSITRMGAKIVEQADRIAELESALDSVYRASCEREIMEDHGLKGTEAGYHDAVNRIKPHPLLMNASDS